ncbi:MAG: S-adenosylmethionine:tRNA ribosyltransferase-isomerase, partial [Nanobdellota archaeon]
MPELDLSDFDYYLPRELIAQEPVRPRDSSKLLVVNNTKIWHLIFRDIVDYFNKGDVLVLNNT